MCSTWMAAHQLEAIGASRLAQATSRPPMVHDPSPDDRSSRPDHVARQVCTTVELPDGSSRGGAQAAARDAEDADPLGIDGGLCGQPFERRRNTPAECCAAIAANLQRRNTRAPAPRSRARPDRPGTSSSRRSSIPTGQSSPDAGRAAVDRRRQPVRDRERPSSSRPQRPRGASPWLSQQPSVDRGGQLPGLGLACSADVAPRGQKVHRVDARVIAALRRDPREIDDAPSIGNKRRAGPRRRCRRDDHLGAGSHPETTMGIAWSTRTVFR